MLPEQNIRITWKPSKLLGRNRKAEDIGGYGVQLREKTKEPSNNQIWLFTADGYITSKAFENLALTSVATILLGEDGDFVADGTRMNEDDPFVSFVAVCDKCKADSPFIHRQR